MLFKFLSYLIFLLKSKNEHGVHSPFVFDFVTKGLYQKKIKNIDFNSYKQLKNLSKKKKKILSKIIIYFKIDSVEFDVLQFNTTQEKKYKILYITNLNSLSQINLSNFTPKHIILVDAIYQDKKRHQNWREIIQNDNVTVSIDLFYFGLLFFRPAQAKEHFTIRV